MLTPWFFRLALGIALAAIGVPAGNAADDGRPVREAISMNGQYVLRIEPGRADRAGRTTAARRTGETPPQTRPGAAARGSGARSTCVAMLLARSGERGAGEQLLWQRTLVNEVAPARAFVRDDGQFVVTLDEFRRGGARHAVVVYGSRGELLREFALQNLLRKEDWRHVRARRGNVDWLDGAKFAFDDPQNQFVITLRSRRTLRIDLKKLAAVDDRGRPVTPDIAAIPRGVLDELIQAAAGTGAATKPAGAGMAAATASTQPHPAGAPPVAVGAPAGAAGMPNPAETWSETELAVLPVDPAEPAAAQEARPPQFTAGLAMPPPDPAQKTDYVAWLNSLGVVDGPDAAPLYAQALALAEQAAAAEPNVDVSGAAAGKPEVLTSEAFALWRTEYADALQLFREAAGYPQKSWHFATPDGGMMLSVILPHLAGVRQLAKGCVAEGRYQLMQGQPQEAAACYLDTFAAGAQWSHDPTIISNLVGPAVQNLAAEALLDLAADPAAAGLDFAQLAAEAEMACQPVRPAAEEIQFERAFFLDVAQRLWDVEPETGERMFNGKLFRQVFSTAGSGQESGLGTFLTAAGVAMQGYESMVSAGNAYYDAAAAAMAQPYPEARPRLDALEQRLSEPSSPDVHPALRLFAPSLTRYHFIQTRGKAARRAAVLVTQLQAYRQQYGTYPESLDAFAEREFAVDPFTAAPFVYQQAGDEFVLYSAGGNMTDDGGVHDRKGEINDLVFWPRPPKQP